MTQKLIDAIKDQIKLLDQWIAETKAGGYSTQHLDAMNKQSFKLKAMLYDLGECP